MTEYSVLQEEYDVLQRNYESLMHENENLRERNQKLQSQVETKDSSLQSLKDELEDLMNENIRLYETMENSNDISSNKVNEIGLDMENKHLKESIVKLYNVYHNESETNMKRIKELESSLQSIENSQQSELGQLCAKYQMDIISLRIKVEELEKKCLSEEETKSLQEERDYKNELLALDESLLNEYKDLMEEKEKEVGEKKEMLLTVVNALQTVLTEKEKARMGTAKEDTVDVADCKRMNSQYQLLKKEKGIDEIRLQYLANENQRYSALYQYYSYYLPSTSSSYFQHCNTLSNLLFIASTTNTIISSYTTTSSPFVLSPSISMVLLYLTKMNTGCNHYHQLLSASSVSSPLFIRLLQEIQAPLQRLYGFCKELVEKDGSMWEMNKEVLDDILVIESYMEGTVKEGDCIWRRNYECIQAEGIVQELLIMAYTHNASITHYVSVLDLAGVTALSQEQTALLASLSSLQTKIGLMHKQITEDRYAGTPRLCDDSKGGNHGVDCYDNSPLWRAVKQLKKEYMVLFKKGNSIFGTNKSLLLSLSVSSSSPVLSAASKELDMSVCYLFIIPSSYLCHLCQYRNHVEVVLNKDLFITSVVIISNASIPCVIPLSQRILSIGKEMKVEDDKNDKKDKKEDKEEIRALKENEELKKMVRDLMIARETLSNQMKKKQDVLESAVGGDTEEKLQVIVDKKKSEIKMLMKEMSGLKKELQTIKSKGQKKQVSGEESTTTERYLLMKENLNQARMKNLRRVIDKLPSLHMTKRVPPVVSSPASSPLLLLQCLNNTIIDPSVMSVDDYDLYMNYHYCLNDSLLSLRPAQTIPRELETSHCEPVSTLTMTVPSNSPLLSLPSSVPLLLQPSQIHSIHAAIV